MMNVHADPLLYLAINFGIRKNAKTDIRNLPKLASEILECRGSDHIGQNFGKR